ncbi:MAG: extracellular solute-binding protein, partial [Candidatus Ornithomonoglobus sp.]
MNNWKKISMLVIAMGLAAGVLAGCGSEPIPVGIDTSEPSISVMTSATKTNPAGQDSPVVQEIERYLGEAMSKKYDKQYDKVNLDLQWVATTAYGEKVTAAMGANEYPHVMLVTTRNSSVIQNSKAGTFWDITDAFTKTDAKYVSEENPEGYVYPKLAQANATVNRNISVDGKIFGVYRARVIGRQGVTIRKDWLDNLGLEIPKTIDDFEEVLKQFTVGDPDGNGKDDTYGMIVTSYLDGPLHNLAVWMGSPNEWGYDESTGEWKPWFMSQG